MTASAPRLDTAPRPAVPLTELRRTVRRYAANPNLAALLPDTGEATRARLAGDARSDVWLVSWPEGLVSWPEGAETGWHDHGGAAGAFAVASGTVLEETWALGAVQHRRLAEGDSRVFGPDHVHQVVGAGPGRALTVHAYAPGLVTLGRREPGAPGPTGSRRRDGGPW